MRADGRLRPRTSLSPSECGLLIRKAPGGYDAACTRLAIFAMVARLQSVAKNSPL
jgi:hypothetical protein